MSSIFSSNSEAFASELLENIDDMLCDIQVMISFADSNILQHRSVSPVSIELTP